ncbi:MAG: FeoB-associated Cys-rich membrane protein [Bacteroidales bacterium]|nr:FeoB-associated Cys-rich membrane protein [Candidatus Colimorpha merdihippi]
MNLISWIILLAVIAAAGLAARRLSTIRKKARTESCGQSCCSCSLMGMCNKKGSHA